MKLYTPYHNVRNIEATTVEEKNYDGVEPCAFRKIVIQHMYNKELITEEIWLFGDTKQDLHVNESPAAHGITIESPLPRIESIPECTCDDPACNPLA